MCKDLMKQVREEHHKRQINTRTFSAVSEYKTYFGIETTNFHTNQLECPFCGNEYTHIDNVEFIPRDIADPDAYASVSFWCESGHRWSIEFKHHKGITEISYAEQIKFTD
ncbi:MAG: hypothetical protein IJ113_00950 [Eggerthellaceae bacterium]|nr:hypothetical protein [Eggerthellaceae bacterium]